MKILWLTNIPSPYRVKFFNELGKYCDLTVLFEKSASSERDESWKSFNTENYNAVFLKGKSIGVAEAFCPSVIRYINKSYDHIVVTNFSDLTGMLAILTLKLKRISYEIESDGAFPGTGKGLKERLKKFLLQKAKLYFSTASIHDDYYRMYGAKDSEIIRYPFTSLYSSEVIGNPVSHDDKKAIRKELGLNENKIILAVGQFIHRKGYDVLIKAAAKLDDYYGVYIIGGKATKEYIDLKNDLKTNNVHFVDFKKPNELKKYYMASDIFVHPTREDIWGLVINEAMASGLPVVTTDKCIAGLEMVDNGINGYIVEAEDYGALADAISSCKNDMSEMTISKAQKYTIERMVKAHLDIWK